MSSIAAAQEGLSIRDRIATIKKHFGLPRWVQRLQQHTFHNNHVNQTLAAINALPHISPILKNNAPAIKQLNALVTESRVVAHTELAMLSKPTATYTKDRIFNFVEDSPSVTVAEISYALPDVARSGISSRVSEMYRAGILKREYKQGANGWQMHYTVAETK